LHLWWGPGLQSIPARFSPTTSIAENTWELMVSGEIYAVDFVGRIAENRLLSASKE
jgi:hypothetical protein